MAKKTQPNRDGKAIVVEDAISITQTFPKELFSKIIVFRKASGLSTEQEAIRFIVNHYLNTHGF